MLPQFLSDEWHERMKHAEKRIKESKSGLQCSTIGTVAICRLNHLKIPRREFIPEQTICCHESLGDTEFTHKVLDFGKSGVKLSLKPAHCLRRSLRLRLVLNLPTLYETESIPYLVAEIASLLAEFIVIHDIVSGRSGKHQTHTHAIGAILRDQVERIGRVAKAFRHLATDRVAHDAGKVYIVERLLTHIFIACHDHARNPEEDNIRTCNKRRCRIIILYLLIAGIIDAVEKCDRP